MTDVESYHHFGKKRNTTNHRLHPTSIQSSVDLHSIAFRSNCLADQNPTLRKSRFHFEKTSATYPHRHTVRSRCKTVFHFLTCLLRSTLHQSGQWPGQCSSVDSNLEPRPMFYTLWSEYTGVKRTKWLTEALLGKMEWGLYKISTTVQQFSISQLKNDLLVNNHIQTQKHTHLRAKRNESVFAPLLLRLVWVSQVLTID